MATPDVFVSQILVDFAPGAERPHGWVDAICVPHTPFLCVVRDPNGWAVVSQFHSRALVTGLVTFSQAFAFAEIATKDKRLTLLPLRADEVIEKAGGYEQFARTVGEIAARAKEETR